MIKNIKGIMAVNYIMAVVLLITSIIFAYEVSSMKLLRHQMLATQAALDVSLKKAEVSFEQNQKEVQALKALKWDSVMESKQIERNAQSLVEVSAHVRDMQGKVDWVEATTGNWDGFLRQILNK